MAFRGKLAFSSWRTASLDYNRQALGEEIEVTPSRYLNNHFFEDLVSDFIKYPWKLLFIGASYWGEEHQPHWT